MTVCDLVVMSTRTVDHSSYTIVMVLEHPGILVVIPLILPNTGNNCHRLCTRSLLSGKEGKSAFRLIEIFRMYFDTS